MINLSMAQKSSHKKISDKKKKIQKDHAKAQKIKK